MANMVDAACTAVTAVVAYRLSIGGRQVQGSCPLSLVNRLVQDVLREPISGVGKPEPPKHALAGWWSRRITGEHRMVYRIEGDALLLAQLRYRY